MRNLTKSKSEVKGGLLMNQITSLISQYGKLDSGAMYTLLKEKGISDDEIGKALGMTRQAVWTKYQLPKNNDN